MNTELRESWLLDILRKHPALLVSALYVVASTIGMLFSWDYLRQFGINVFNYAQIGDFLLASLKEPITWGLVVFAGSLVVIDNAISRRWQRGQRSRWTRWYGSGRYRTINFILMPLMLIIFIDGYARYKARETYEGGGKIIEYVLADSPTQRTATLLGTTARFVFLLDENGEKVFVLPHESIAMMSFPAPGN